MNTRLLRRFAASCAAIPSILLAAAPAPAAPPAAAGPVVDLGTAKRCAVVFGLIAAQQQSGAPGADRYPPMNTRGREFFVQVGARMMDEQHLDRDAARTALQGLAAATARDVASAPDPSARMRQLADPCLPLLDAAIPVR